MPRYAALIYSDEVADAGKTPEEWAGIAEEYDEFGDMAGRAGVISGGEALQDSVTATTVRVLGGARGGEVVVTDGPCEATTQVLGGFYLLDCADLDEALRWAAQIPAAWHGRVEVRPVIDFTQQG